MSQKPFYGPVKTTSPTYFRASNWGSETDTSIELVSTAFDPNEAIRGILGAGLVLGKITASGKYAQYHDSASDGTEVAVGFLKERTDIRDRSGALADGQATLVQVAEIIESKIPGDGTLWGEGYTGLDALAKADMVANNACSVVYR